VQNEKSFSEGDSLNVASSRQVYERYIRVKVRHKIKDFSQFWKLYLGGHMKLRDKTKEIEDTVAA